MLNKYFGIRFTVISTVNCERVYYSCWHFSFATCCIPPNNYFLDLMPMVEGFFMIITNSNQLHWFSHFGPFFSLPRLLFSYLKVISRHTFDRVYANPCNKGMAIDYNPIKNVLSCAHSSNAIFFLVAPQKVHDLMMEHFHFEFGRRTNCVSRARLNGQN